MTTCGNKDGAARLIFNQALRSHVTLSLVPLHWPLIRTCMKFSSLVLAYRSINGQAPIKRPLTADVSKPMPRRAPSTVWGVSPQMVLLCGSLIVEWAIKPLSVIRLSLHLQDTWSPTCPINSFTSLTFFECSYAALTGPYVVLLGSYFCSNTGCTCTRLDIHSKPSLAALILWLTPCWHVCLKCIICLICVSLWTRASAKYLYKYKCKSKLCVEDTQAQPIKVYPKDRNKAEIRSGLKFGLLGCFILWQNKLWRKHHHLQHIPLTHTGGQSKNCEVSNL